MIAFYGVEEDRPLENLQLEPDIKVATPFEEILYGKRCTDRSSRKTAIEGNQMKSKKTYKKENAIRVSG